jgi:hypothetical protein
VRWLSGYTKAEVYGADDQNSRHVSNWVVEFIVASFLRRFLLPGLSASLVCPGPVSTESGGIPDGQRKSLV